MAPYVDGFALPIPRDRLDEYQRVAREIAEVWKSHGALEYREFVGDDMEREGLRWFTGVLDAKEDEAVVFGWVVFPSREVRDAANEAVPKDPKMAALFEGVDIGFDSARMAYGGFEPLV